MWFNFIFKEGEWQKFDGVVRRHGLGVLAAVQPVAEGLSSSAEQPGNGSGNGNGNGSGNGNGNGSNNGTNGVNGGAGGIGEIVEWIYEGEWKEDMMHGRGVFRFPSGAVFDVRPTSTLASSRLLASSGFPLFPSNFFLKGEWENNKYMGTGRYMFPDGSHYEGAFYDNKYTPSSFLSHTPLIHSLIHSEFMGRVYL
jgi:hypothetical protein